MSRRSLLFPIGIVLLLTAAPAFAQSAPAAHGLTPWSMFVAADWVVKAIMLILVAASVATWGIALARHADFRRTIRALAHDRATLDEAMTLAEVAPLASGAGAAILHIARAEVGGAVDLSASASADALTNRFSIRLTVIEGNAVQTVRAGMSVLASIGATAPFIGLFGTVWGIMNSFVGIAEAHTTNLAVVAPGIAEALLATALGLVAAIPAVLLYNLLSRRIAGFRQALQDVSARVACLVSIDIERAQVDRPAAARRTGS